MLSLGRQPVGWDGHLLLLHRSESQRRAGVCAWVRRGLELGEKIVYTEPPEQPAGRSLVELLQDEADASVAIERHQIEVVLAHETAYDPAWQAAMVGHALDEGYPSVRWSGEAATAWAVMPRARHAEVERATDALCRSQRLSVMCQYSLSDAGAELADFCAVHGAGVRDGLLTALPFDGGLGVAGEADLSNRDTLGALLSAATSTSEREEFVVELSGLDLLDVGGTRALVRATTSYREGGGLVRLAGARPHVAHLIRLLRVQRLPGLLIEAM